MRTSILLLLLALPCSAADRPPNVVLIYCDDMGYADIGPFGAKEIKTPNLDRLGSEGRKLTSFRVAQAVCSASRAALLTGCYPNRIGILGALGPNSRNGIYERETTIAEMLKAKGYATAIYGKWHLGHLDAFNPLKHGFDDWLGLPYSNDMWPNHPTGKYPPLPLMEGNKVKEMMPDQRQLTTWYTERAVKFIDANKAKPFFVYLPHAMPHVPLFVSDKFAGKSKAGLYGDVIEEIDWSVGQVLDALKRNDLERNTIVIFTSDNGPWLNYRSHAGSAGPLREGKGTSFEGGIRVPFLVRFPGVVPAGSVSKEPAMTIDMLPTLAKWCGADVPKLKIDGRDVSAILSGDGKADQPYFHYWGQALEAVSLGKWKLHFPHEYRTTEGEPAAPGKPSKQGTAKIGLALFDLEADEGEKTDVKDKYPEIVEKLQKQTDAMRKDLGDTLKGAKGDGVRGAGVVPKE